MHSDDVFRARLSETVAELDRWAATLTDVATIEMAETSTYWRMAVRPFMVGAAPFDLLIEADQKFSLNVAGEIYEKKPVDSFEFFPKLARAIAAGHVERIESRCAMTGALELVDTRITLDDGWAWIGERRCGLRQVARAKAEAAAVSRSHRFLPYRR